MSTQSYADKREIYFGNPRKDIDPLLPVNLDRVLEIGCGSGATLAWLKRERGCKHAIGVELFEAAAAQAREHTDVVFEGDAEQVVLRDLTNNKFDLVLCLDVLEHLVDPWAFVERIEALISPGGYLIVSLPNVRNLNVLIPLLFKGRWQYQVEGILDRTHLRFFTLESALTLARGKCLIVDQLQRNIPGAGSKSAWLNRLSLGGLRDLLTVQYVIRARKS